MSKFAARITIPVTNANVQENSTRSMTSLVTVRSPSTGPFSCRGLRPLLEFGRKVTAGCPKNGQRWRIAAHPSSVHAKPQEIEQMEPGGRFSNDQRQQLNNAHSDDQHCERYGIVI